MKFLKYLLCGAGMAALLAFGSCTQETPDNNDGEQDDAYYASLATVTSSDSAFTAGDGGGTVSFSAKGGTAVIKVDCGTGWDWSADNNINDIFDVVVNLSSNTMTVTAEQNYSDSGLSSTITFMTASQKVKFATVAVTQDAYGAPEITLGTTEWNIPAVGELSTEISVESSTGSWEVENDSEWLSVESTDGGIVLTAEENAESTGRSGIVTLTASDARNSVSATVTVNQDAKAYISLSESYRAFDAAGGTYIITVDHNMSDYDLDYDSTGFLNVDKDGEKLTLTVAANGTGEEREAVVTLSCGDGAENGAETTLTVKQYSTSAFIMTYTVGKGNNEVLLPLSGNGLNCIVDWGDGSEYETVTKQWPTHTYEVYGEYTVAVTGTVTALSYYSNDNLTAVRQWGKTGFTSLDNAFNVSLALASVPADTENSFAAVTSMNNMFNYCSSLKTLPEGLFASASNVRSMTYCFEYSGLKEIPSDLFDNCTSLIDVSGLFKSCTSLKEIPSGLFDKCTSITNISEMFWKCTGITSVPSTLFQKCADLKTCDYAFYGSNITSIPSGFFKGLAKVESFEGVASFCVELSTVESEAFANCTSATSFCKAFQGSGLQSIAADAFSGCTAVEDFSWGFDMCCLTSVPGGLFDSFANVTNMSEAFKENVFLKTLPDELFKNCTKITSFESLCYGCTALESIPADLFSYSPLNQSFHATFCLCTSLKEIPKGLFDNNTSVQIATSTFWSCSLIKEIPEGLFDTFRDVYTMGAVFELCSSLETIPDGLFDKCAEVLEMSYLFMDCSSLKKIPDGLFDYCTKVQYFYGTFYDCTSLTSVPKRLFCNCPDIMNFAFAFRGCYNITDIPVDILDNCNSISNFQASFYVCVNWEGESPYTVVNGEKVHLYERTAALGFTAPTTKVVCFTGDEKLTDYNDIPSAWRGSDVVTSQSSAGTMSLTPSVPSPVFSGVVGI